MGLVAQRVDQSLGNPRLPDPRPAGEQDELGVTSLRLSPALDQEGELLIARDDRCQSA
jgi:hypothetical protein